jgi:hypothetical protein
MLELIYTSNKTVTTGSNLNYCHMYYVRTWDALILHDTNYPAKAYKLFRDGSQAVIISAAASGIKLMGRVNGQHCWLYSYIYDGYIWAADEISGNYHSNSPLHDNWILPLNSFRPGNFIDDRQGIAIYQYVGVLHFIDLATGTELGTLRPGATVNHICWAGENRVMAIEYSTGKVFFIDYVNRITLSTARVAGCALATYDCIHNLIITLGSDKKIRVYILEVAPATLAAPVFIPTAAHQHRLIGTRIRTRLTGSAGEPCPDYWINWSLLGVPPKGALLKDKSKTDIDGYAENYWYGPLGAGETGEETIRVNVQVPS